MKIQLNWAELLLVVTTLVFGGIIFGIFFEKLERGENSNEWIYGLMALFAAGIIILKKRVRVKKG